MITVLPTGSIWQQELRVNGFVLGQQLVIPSISTLPCRCTVDSAVLLFALQGRLRFEMGNGASDYLEEKQYCLIICPADHPLFLSAPADSTHTFQLAFSLRMLQKLPGANSTTFGTLPNDAISRVEILPYRFALSTPVQQLLNRAFSVKSPPGPYPILHLNETSLKLLKRFTDDRTTYHAQQRWVEKKQLSITELSSFLSDHLDVGSREQVTLIACAKRMQLEVSLFKQLFRSRYGVTLSKYLYHQRMQRAFLLLSQRGQLPGAVYSEVGYHNFSSFSRAFASYFGQLPSAVSTTDK